MAYGVVKLLKSLSLMKPSGKTTLACAACVSHRFAVTATFRCDSGASTAPTVGAGRLRPKWPSNRMKAPLFPILGAGRPRREAGGRDRRPGLPFFGTEDCDVTWTAQWMGRNTQQDMQLRTEPLSQFSRIRKQGEPHMPGQEGPHWVLTEVHQVAQGLLRVQSPPCLRSEVLRVESLNPFSVRFQ